MEIENIKDYRDIKIGDVIYFDRSNRYEWYVITSEPEVEYPSTEETARLFTRVNVKIIVYTIFKTHFEINRRTDRLSTSVEALINGSVCKYYHSDDAKHISDELSKVYKIYTMARSQITSMVQRITFTEPTN